jgi:hypothetical protein
LLPLNHFTIPLAILDILLSKNSHSFKLQDAILTNGSFL